MTVATHNIKEVRRSRDGVQIRTVEARWERATRTSDGRMKVSGFAAVYNSRSADLGGFVEILKPGAFRNAISTGDQCLLYNHDRNAVLARRSVGTLELEDTPKGLRVTAEIVDTSVGRDAFKLIESGHVYGMSFAFTMRGGRESWDESQRPFVCTVHEIGELREVSAVVDPAYEATSISAQRSKSDKAAVVERAKKKRDAIMATSTRGRLALRPVEAYGPDSGYSWFRDLASVAYAERQIEYARTNRKGGTRDFIGYGDLFGSRSEASAPGGLEEARARLDTIQRRDSVVGDFFAVEGSPTYVSEIFATAARRKATLANVLPTLELPETGLIIETGRLTTGAVALARADNGGVTETNLAGERVEAPVGEIAGHVDVGRIALERAAPGFDAAIAMDLGEAVGTALDDELLYGDGTLPHLLGLTQVGSITETAYTDASPTQQEAWAKLLQNIAAVADALGYPPSSVLASPRRIAWFANTKDSNGVLSVPTLPFDMTWVPVPVIRTTGGAGTNEDEILVVAAAELPLLIKPPAIRAYPEVNSSTGVIRISGWQYAGLIANRRPEAIGRVSGTGLTSPVFA